MVPGNGTQITPERLAAYLAHRRPRPACVEPTHNPATDHQGCAQRQEAGAACDPGAISFDKYLAKVNREDRVDLSTAARAAYEKSCPRPVEQPRHPAAGPIATVEGLRSKLGSVSPAPPPAQSVAPRIDLVA